MYDFLEEHLKTKIIPFWNRQADTENGGFYGYAQLNLVTDKYADKGSIKIARILWAYSAMYLHYRDPAYLEFARIAYAYLTEHLYDNIHKGVYWKSSYCGKIINESKHIYAQSFAIYGLSEYYLASSEIHAKELAMEIFAAMEKHAFQPEKNCYTEQFKRDWTADRNTLLQDDHEIPYYTANSILHLIEAYTSLYIATKAVRVYDRLKSLLDLFYEKIYDKTDHRCLIAFDENWESIDNSLSFGHDIEASWLLDQAMDAIGYHPEAYGKMTRELCENIYRNAYSEGMINSTENNGIINRTLVWWIQAEAVVGFINRYERSRNRLYLDAADKTLEVIMTKIVDHREGGEWYWSVDRNGHPLEDYGISENWKANYHNVRMCLEVLKRRGSF